MIQDEGWEARVPIPVLARMYHKAPSQEVFNKTDEVGINVEDLRNNVFLKIAQGFSPIIFLVLWRYLWDITILAFKPKEYTADKHFTESYALLLHFEFQEIPVKGSLATSGRFTVGFVMFFSPGSETDILRDGLIWRAINHFWSW